MHLGQPDGLLGQLQLFTQLPAVLGDATRIIVDMGPQIEPGKHAVTDTTNPAGEAGLHPSGGRPVRTDQIHTRSSGLASVSVRNSSIRSIMSCGMGECHSISSQVTG